MSIKDKRKCDSKGLNSLHRLMQYVEARARQLVSCASFDAHPHFQTNTIQIKRQKSLFAGISFKKKKLYYSGQTSKAGPKIETKAKKGLQWLFSLTGT